MTHVAVVSLQSMRWAVRARRICLEPGPWPEASLYQGTTRHDFLVAVDLCSKFSLFSGCFVFLALSFPVSHA